MKPALDPFGVSSASPLAQRLFATRRLTLALAAPLSDADAAIQPFPDASPAKWHLAHTTWFFETFVLRDHVSGYRPFDERFAYLFNSYYEGEGPRHARPRRGMLSRPSLDEVRAYRAHVDAELERALPTLPPVALELIELGINHEQQHQELFLTDILATFAENPLEPAYAALPASACFATEPLSWHKGREGIVEIGAGDGGFAFDSERPRHRVLLSSHELAGRKVTNGEWRDFMADGGYRTPTLWLSDGWVWVQEQAIEAPLYWRDEGSEFTLGGRREIDWAAPVAHVSSTKPMLSPAGPALGSRPRPNGRISRPPPTRTSATSSTMPAPSFRGPEAASSATSGNGPRAPSRPTPASLPRKARSANITASS